MSHEILFILHRFLKKVLSFCFLCRRDNLQIIVKQNHDTISNIVREDMPCLQSYIDLFFFLM